jgi:ParB family chromosome partitioning protein
LWWASAAWIVPCGLYPAHEVSGTSVRKQTRISRAGNRHLRRALGGLLVEITILHATLRQNAVQVLRDAATAYKVGLEAIGLKVKQEFAMKAKAKGPRKLVTKAVPQKARKSA